MRFHKILAQFQKKADSKHYFTIIIKELYLLRQVANLPLPFGAEQVVCSVQ